MKNNYRKNKLVLMDNIKKTFTLLIMSVFINVLFNSTVFADAAAEYGVDYMETFDDLQDWTGSAYGDRIVPAEMPVKSDGSPSVWQYYSNWQNDYSQTWIGNHGTENVWGGTGKSLIIDYVGNKGPSRLGTYIGDGSPQAGYDEVYIFEMVKFPKDFFNRLSSDNQKFEFFAYHKFFQVSTGFREIMEWGTVEQQAASSDTQTRNIYGQNYIIFNWNAASGTENELVVNYNPRTSNKEGTGSDNLTATPTSAQISQFVISGSWFGIEYHLKRGSVDNYDGSYDVWIYNSSGEVVSSYSAQNENMIKNFDHKYNKFVIGGNRSFSSESSHLYIDDFIINDSRVGPNYFAKKLTDLILPSIPVAVRLK